MMNEIIFGVVGLVFGILVAWFIWAAYKPKAQMLEFRLLDELKNQERSEEKLAALQADLTQAIADKARFEQALQSAKAQVVEKEAFLQKAEQTLAQAFAKISSENLKAVQSQFLELAHSKWEDQQKFSKEELQKRQDAVQNLVKPVQDQLKNLTDFVNQVDKDRISTYQSIAEQMRLLNEGNLKVEKEAASLSRALRNPTSRGQWGELQLQRVIELAGMKEHCDFETQAYLVNDEGQRQRPDMRILLPGQRYIYIDAKTPYEAYAKSFETVNEEEKAQLKLKHVSDLKGHIKALSTKAYDKNQMNTPDFVVLFLPSESFFQAALEQDIGLIDFASQYNIILSTPTTLIALLKTISYGWRQEALAQNAVKVSEEATRFLERCVVLDKHFQSLAKNLKQTVDSYNKVAGSFEKNVLTSALNLKKMGVSLKDEINEEMIRLDIEPRSLEKVERLRIQGDIASLSIEETNND